MSLKDAAGPDSKFNLIERVYRERHKDFNIIVVDWLKLGAYYDSYKFVPEVAGRVAEKLDEVLGNNEKAWRDLKIVGHSLGAHIAGFVGKKVKNGRVGTIIGLDPAGELFF